MINMPKKMLSEELRVEEYFNFTRPSPLTVEQAEIVAGEIGELRKTLRGRERYIAKANRKFVKLFGLPWRVGMSYIKDTPEYTKEEMVDIVLESNLKKSNRSAMEFVDNLIETFTYQDKYDSPPDVDFENSDYHYGIFLSDGLLATRYGAFKKIERDGKTLYKPMIMRDSSMTGMEMA